MQPDGSWKIHGIWELSDAGGSLGDFDDGLAAALLGTDFSLYANIHTVANGGGEIRGQLVCMATDAGETINDTAGNDLLFGLGGNDRIVSYAGKDAIDGGTGAGDLAAIDRSTSSLAFTLNLTNPSVLHTLADGTTLINVERLEFHGGSGKDLITGGALVDRLFGGGNADTLVGAAGNDFLDGGLGRDRMRGNLGNDTYFVDNRLDVIGGEAAGQGTLDKVLATVGYALSATAAIEVLHTSSTTPNKAINLIGNGFSNRVVGNAAANTLKASAARIN